MTPHLLCCSLPLQGQLLPLLLDVHGGGEGPHGRLQPRLPLLLLLKEAGEVVGQLRLAGHQAVHLLVQLRHVAAPLEVFQAGVDISQVTSLLGAEVGEASNTV